VVRSQTELERYDGCTAIDGDLLVENVDSLAPLEALESVAGGLRIERTNHLYSLSGLERLRSVRELKLSANRALINGGALQGLAHAQRVQVTQNPRLSRGFGFEESLARSGARIDLENNVGLSAEGMEEFRSATSRTTVAAR
jgi:hypothetical protein